MKKAKVRLVSKENPRASGTAHYQREYEHHSFTDFSQYVKSADDMHLDLLLNALIAFHVRNRLGVYREQPFTDMPNKTGRKSHVFASNS